MKKKRVFKTLAYTLLMIGTISTCSLTPSGAKYQKDSIDSEILHYSSTFKQMKAEVKSQHEESGSKSHTLKYNFTFDRNSIINSKDKQNDKYEISVSDGCEIEKIIALNGKVEDPNVISNKKIVTYDNENDDEISVKLSCSVADITKDDYLKFNMDVYEIFNNDFSDDGDSELKYLYLTGTDENIYPSSEYAKNHPVINLTEGKRIEIDPEGKSASEIYEEFKTWINAYTTEAIGENSIGYIKKYFTTDEYIGSEGEYNNYEKFNRPDDGMTAKFENGKYIFEIDDNFTSYVKTYTNTSNIKKIFYFYNENASKNEQFMKYINLYLYPSDTKEKEYTYIENYVNANANAPNDIITLASSGAIPGITYDANQKCLEVASNIYNRLSKTIPKVSIDLTKRVNTQMFAVYNGIFDINFISVELNTQFFSKYIKPTEVETTNYSKVLYDGQDYILVRISSEEGSTTAYIDVEYIDNIVAVEILRDYEINGNVSLSDLDLIAPRIQSLKENEGKDYNETLTIEADSYDILLNVSCTSGGKFNIEVTKVDKINEPSIEQTNKDSPEDIVNQAPSEEQQSLAKDISSDDNENTISDSTSDDSDNYSSSENDNQESDSTSDINPLLEGEPIINNGGNIE